MQIAFWSPNHGQTGTTTATVAYGVMAALTQNYKVLLTHSQFGRSTMERSLVKEDKNLSKDITYISNHGVGALRRLARNGRLEKGMLRDYTTSLLSNSNLDLLEGIDVHDSNTPREEIALLRHIYKVAQEEYDLIFIDVHSGMKNEMTKYLLEDADIVVVCLNQNIQLIERFIGNKEEQKLLKGKNVIYHIGRYDNNSRYRSKNLQKLYGLKPMMTLPYLSGYLDACNQSSALDYIMRNGEVKQKDPSFEFMNSIKIGIDQLMKMTQSREREAVTLYGKGEAIS